jgi:hypothetical protein
MKVLFNKNMQSIIAILSFLCLSYIALIIAYSSQGTEIPVMSFFAELFTIPVIGLVGLLFLISVFSIFNKKLNTKIIISLLLSTSTILLMIFAK